MKYLAGIGSVRSPGDIISEQSRLPIKRSSGSFQANFHLFQSYRIIDGLGLSCGFHKCRDIPLLGAWCHQDEHSSDGFLQQSCVLHSLAPLDGHSSSRVAFIFVSENFARKLFQKIYLMKDSCLQARSSRPVQGRNFLFLAAVFFLLPVLLLKIGDTRTATIACVSGASQQYSLCYCNS